jgi:hypothetical protein
VIYFTDISRIFIRCGFAACLGLILVVTTDAQEADQNGIYVNKRPLKDWSKRFTQAVALKEINLDAPFVVSVSGTLDVAKDGKTVILKDVKKSIIEQPIGSDPRLRDLVENAVLAASDSGWFGYLSAMGRMKTSKSVKLLIEQDARDFSASINVDQQTENEARTLASALSAVISIGSATAKDDEKLLLRSLSVSTVGNAVNIISRTTKSQFWEIIQRKLAAEEIRSSNK